MKNYYGTKALALLALAFVCFAYAGTTTSRLEGLTGEVSIKVPVRVATTANITLSGTQTIDAIAVVADDRVLVKDQTAGTENGIYIASATAWTRAKDFNGARDTTKGTMVLVLEGTVGSTTLHMLNTDAVIFGTTSISFIQLVDY